MRIIGKEKRDECHSHFVHIFFSLPIDKFARIIPEKKMKMVASPIMETVVIKFLESLKWKESLVQIG